MPRLTSEDPKSLESLLATFGTRDLGIDPEDIRELLDQADTEIREAEWDLQGNFPDGSLKSSEMAVLKMGLALALGYCRRLAAYDSGDRLKGSRTHRNAALLLWFWSRDRMPAAEPFTSQLVEVIERRNDYGYRGRVVSPSEAADIAAMTREVRNHLGDEPIRIYDNLMAQLRAARAVEKPN